MIDFFALLFPPGEEKQYKLQSFLISRGGEPAARVKAYNAWLALRVMEPNDKMRWGMYVPHLTVPIAPPACQLQQIVNYNQELFRACRAFANDPQGAGAVQVPGMLRVTRETHDVKGSAGERLHIVEEEGRMVVLAEPVAETFNMLREQITVLQREMAGMKQAFAAEMVGVKQAFAAEAQARAEQPAHAPVHQRDQTGPCRPPTVGDGDAHAGIPPAGPA
jgi:hypothetical protein